MLRFYLLFGLFARTLTLGPGQCLRQIFPSILWCNFFKVIAQNQTFDELEIWSLCFSFRQKFDVFLFRVGPIETGLQIELKCCRNEHRSVYLWGEYNHSLKSPLPSSHYSWRHATTISGHICNSVYVSSKTSEHCFAVIKCGSYMLYAILRHFYALTFRYIRAAPRKPSWQANLIQYTWYFITWFIKA